MKGRAPRLLHVVQAVAWVAAVGALALPTPADRVSGTAVVVLLVATPLARVFALAVWWGRVQDTRFARLAWALLGTVGAVALVAVLR